MKDIVCATNITVTLSIVNLLVLSFCAYLLYRQIRTNHEWNRLKSAHEMIFDSHLGPFRQLRNNLESRIDIYDISQTYETKKVMLDKADIMALESILNYFDNVCLGVKNHVMDEDTVFDSLSGILIAYFRWAKPYITLCRSINARFWIDIDPYVEEWSTRHKDIVNRMVVTGKPAL